MARTTKKRSSRAVPKDASTHQALKSAQTRSRLIEATIRCLIKYGFANTTTPKVAAEARLSRGAMLHHFESGAALIEATIIELHEKRLRALRRYAMTDHSDVRALVHSYWQQLTSSTTFVAFHELALAARTDKQIGRVLIPLQQEYQERWYSEVVALFPEWQADRASFDLALTMSRVMLEGMALGRQTASLSEEAVPRLLDVLEAQIRSLRPAVPGAPTANAVEQNK